MDPINASNLDFSALEMYKQMGLEPETMMDLLGQATPDPVTGEIGPEEVIRHLIRNYDNPVVQQLGRIAQDAIKTRANAYDEDFTTFDFNSLASTIPENPVDGWWHLTLERYAYANPAGNIIPDEDAPSVPGAQPMFFLNCEHSSVIRLIEHITGLPDSKTVLRFLKRAIVTPCPGLIPALPRFLQISVKFTAHRTALQPFLDSLPAPFAWEIETPQIAQTVHDVVDERMQQKYLQFMGAAEIAKAAGNSAFNSKDRQAAIEQYTAAINRAWDAASVRQHTDQRKVAHRLMALCYANRAATHLLPGEGINAEKAIEDSQQAERYDPDYAKGYYRQAKAYQLSGDVEKAQEALRRGLSRPSLAGERSLLGLLNELDIQLD